MEEWDGNDDVGGGGLFHPGAAATISLDIPGWSPFAGFHLHPILFWIWDLEFLLPGPLQVGLKNTTWTKSSHLPPFHSLNNSLCICSSPPPNLERRGCWEMLSGGVYSKKVYQGAVYPV